MIKIIYFIFSLSESHELELKTIEECHALAEKIHELQPDYEVWCCDDGKCERVILTTTRGITNELG